VHTRNAIVNMRKCPQGVFDSIGGRMNILGELWCWENDDLRMLPENVMVSKAAIFFRCENLKTMPERMIVGDGLYISGSRSVESLPRNTVVLSDILARGCTSLSLSGDFLRVGGCLDAQDCENIRGVPDDAVVMEYINLTGCDNADARKADNASVRKPIV
jgi:hypothetical protein